jgi:hypothetical protein
MSGSDGGVCVAPKIGNVIFSGSNRIIGSGVTASSLTNEGYELWRKPISA